MHLTPSGDKRLMKDNSRLLTPQEFAVDYCRRGPERAALKWAARLRQDGTGPKFVKVGRQVRYRLSDVLEWLEANTFSSTSDPGATS